MTEQEFVEREVLAELAQGNFPVCEMCHRVDQVNYMGLCAGVPSFVCLRCSFVFAMDLTDAEGGDD
jgi:hypothetical protein